MEPERRRAIDLATARGKAWDALSPHERERLVLEAIGESKAGLTVSETSAKLERQLFGEPARHFPGVDPRDVRGIVRGLFEAGELERIAVMPGTRGEHAGTRWRWARKPLAGAIAELERVFHESEAT